MTTKRTTRMTFLALGLALPLLALGCAKEPTAEIEAADAALNSAVGAEAEVYAPEAMQGAQDAYAELETELAAQKENFALRRSYARARELAATAQSASEAAATAAREGRERAREEASEVLAELRTSLEEVRALVDKAPKGKGSAADLAALKGDLGGVDTALADVEEAISAERFVEAVQKAQAALESTGEIRAEVERAMETQRAARTRRG